MSSKAVKAVYREAPTDLGPAAMLLLVTLADSVNEEWDWTYVPGVARLAEKAHLSERGGRQACAELVERGLVTKPPRGRTQPIRLAILDPEPAPHAASTGTSCRIGDDAPSSLNQREPHSARSPLKPSATAWSVVNEAKRRENVMVRRADRAAREVDQVLATGVTGEEAHGALDYLDAKPLTAGTLGIAVSKYRQARTREREREERDDLSRSNLPYVTDMGRGTSGGVAPGFYDRISQADR